MTHELAVAQYQANAFAPQLGHVLFEPGNALGGVRITAAVVK